MIEEEEELRSDELKSDDKLYFFGVGPPLCCQWWGGMSCVRGTVLAPSSCGRV